MQIPQIVVDTKAVEPMIVMNRAERKSAGLFIIRNLDSRCQNYAKLKFNTKIILASNGFQLFDLNHEHCRDRSLAFFIRGFDGLLSVY